MSTSRIEELKKDVEELTHLLNAGTRPRVKDILNLEIRKLETEIIKLNEQSKGSPQESHTVSSKVPPDPQKCYDVKLSNYAWDESEKFVKLFVTIKDVQTLPAEQISCTFGNRTVELKVMGLSNRNYFLPINNLLLDIDESKSYWKVKADVVVVFMKKVKPTQWKHLTQSESKLKEATNKPNTNDALDYSGSDPNENLMGLMKKLYNEGDDEMKRTIAKAWTEGKDKNHDLL